MVQMVESAKPEVHEGVYTNYLGSKGSKPPKDLKEVSHYDSYKPQYNGEKTKEIDEFWDMDGWEYFQPAENLLWINMITHEQRHIDTKEIFSPPTRINDGQMSVSGNVREWWRCQTVSTFLKEQDAGKHLHRPSGFCFPAKQVKFVPMTKCVFNVDGEAHENDLAVFTCFPGLLRMLGTTYPIAPEWLDDEV